MKIAYQVDETHTHYVTVDLDVRSRDRLEALSAALGVSVGLHYVGPEGREQGAHFGVRTFPDEDPSRAILTLASLIRKLPVGARRSWDGAHRREFNIGIQAAHKPSSFELTIAPKALQAVAALGGTIAVTVYAPKSNGERKRAPQRAGKPRSTSGRRTTRRSWRDTVRDGPRGQSCRRADHRFCARRADAP